MDKQFHKPEEKWSWQYIDLKNLLKHLKLNIISDFRLNDINNGGEGAPLVPLYHAKIINKFINIHLCSYYKYRRC